MQQAQRVPAPAADAPAQLVELGEAEVLCLQDHHHGGVRHVHADLDDGRGNQHVDLPGGEVLHHLVLVGGIHLAVQHRHAAAGQFLGGDAVAPLLHTGVALNAGRDHVGLTAGLDLLAHALPGAPHPAVFIGGHHHSLDVSAAAGLADQRDGGQVSEHRHAHGARDRGGGHDHHVRGGIHRRGFPQLVALLHAEAVLLVDDHHAQAVELHRVLDHRVRAHHNVGLAGDQIQQRALLVGLLLATDQHGYPHVGVLQHLHQAAGVLHGQDFRRRDKGALVAGVHGPEHADQGHHRLAGADLAVQQQVRRGGSTQAGADVLQRHLLPRAEVEGQPRDQLFHVRARRERHAGALGGVIAAQSHD